jgi:hypothetical protein
MWRIPQTAFLSVPISGAAEYVLGGPTMCKPRETAADRIWKEKLESCASPHEAVVILLFVLALVLVGATATMWE